MTKVKILNFLFRFLPLFWITSGDHCPITDEFLIDCMSKKEYFQRVNRCHRSVRGKNVWVSNYPYSYGGLRDTTRAGAYVSWKLRRYLKMQDREDLKKELGIE